MKSSTDLKAGPALRTKNSGATLPDYDAVIIGAGPYGLSAGAYLRAKGIAVAVFGVPMEFWASKMPKGMLLRSPRVASNIADPTGAFTLTNYESASGVEPSAPVPLDRFVEYGRWFRHQLGSDLDVREVAEVRRAAAGFQITLTDGKAIKTGRVVVAAGIGPFKRTPALLAEMPPQYVSHCYDSRDIDRFTGKRVAVIGAGQSALESAALLHEGGADVEVIARISTLRWIGTHSWLHHLGPITTMLYSSHDVGPLGISRFVAYPKLVHCVPLALRDKIRRRAVRPAGSRWLPARLVNVRVSAGRAVTAAQCMNGELRLKLSDGTNRIVDHVLLGTGYRVDISRYQFLSKDLLEEIRQFDGFPRLASGFRSSVPGLHFIGATAARSFGPLLYFVAGTEFASRELSSHLAGH